MNVSDILYRGRVDGYTSFVKNITVIIQALCLVLILFQPTAFAARIDSPMDCYNDEVVDQAKILTREQRDKLEVKIKEVERKQKVRMGVNIIKKLPDGTEISTYAHKILDERYSDASNGEILLLVDMENRKWYIATSKKMKNKITDGKGIDKLKESFLSDLSNGKYMDSFTAFTEGVDKQLSGDEEEKDSNPDRYNKIYAAVAGILAFAIAVISTVLLVDCMGNVAAAKEANDYLKKDSVDITNQKDTFVGMTVVRVKKSSSSSGSSSSGGGGGGGSF
ncbi:uncharacterized protein SAMN02910323_0396 [Selenomonas ruminantium]|uniref:TPM domain-containing protein n=1 Tax=Selenomonas ruminantium TaxID=971 RepID=A0A1K1LWC9_SELRU|nr:uncharacterized protein SAMN02910323_0396 [Selenomonas ruminantium]